MSKLDIIVLDCVNKALDGKEDRLLDYIDPTKEQIKELLLDILDIEYVSKNSRLYFQPSHKTQNNHKNGFRLALREARKKVEEL